MSDETVFLQLSNATVTSARIILNGTTYALRNVTSVTMRVVPPKVVVLYLLGGLILLAGVMQLVAANFQFGLFATAIGGGMIFFAAKAKSTYIVAMSTSAGQVDALKSTDKSVIQSVVEAINNAIVHKG